MSQEWSSLPFFARLSFELLRRVDKLVVYCLSPVQKLLSGSGKDGFPSVNIEMEEDCTLHINSMLLVAFKPMLYPSTRDATVEILS